MRLERLEGGNYICPDDPGEPTYPGKPKRRSVTDEEAGILRELARGQLVIEIGTGLAVATRAMAETAAHVTTVDPDPWVKDPGLVNVKCLRERPVDGWRCDLAFVDGSHRYRDVRDDIRWVRDMNVRAVAMHDTYLGDVREAINDEGLRLVILWPTLCGLALYTFR